MKGLADAQLRLKAFGTAVQAIGAQVQSVGAITAGLGTALAATGAALAVPFVGAIKSAGDLAESVSKLESVFKGDAQAVKDWAAAYGKAAGRSQLQIQTFLADVGSKLSSFGFSTTEAAQLSETITSLAVGLASFNNMRDSDALGALMSGISGESEPLKRFGVLLNETKLKAELLAKGLNPETATDQEKALARLEFVLKRTRDAQGDEIRTANSFNNRMKALGATLTDVSVSIGQQLLPAAGAMVSVLRTNIATVGEFLQRNQGIVTGVAATAAGLLAGGLAFGTLGRAISIVGSGIGIVGGLIGAIASPLGIVTAALGAGAYAWLNWTDSGKAAANAISSAIGASVTTIGQAVQGIGDALRAGDLALAGRVALAGLNVEFTRAANFIKDVMGGITDPFVEAWHFAGSEIAKVLTYVGALVESTFAKMFDAIRGSIAALVDGLTSALGKVGIDASGLANSGLQGLGIDPAQTAAERQAALDRGVSSNGTENRRKGLPDRTDGRR